MGKCLWFVAVLMACLFSDAKAVSVPHYDLQIELLSSGLKAEGTMAVPSFDAPRETLSLALNELMEDLQVEVLEPPFVSGRASLEKGKTRAWGREGWGTTLWHIRLPKSLPAGSSVRLRFSYRCAAGKSSFIFSLGTEVQFGSGIGTAWYPQIEEADATIRLKGLRGTGRLIYKVDPGVKLYSSGYSLASIEEEKKGLYTYENRSPVFFAFAAAKYITVASQGDPPVSAFLLRDRQRIEDYVRECSKILEVLSQEFGPSPLSPKFAIVEVPPAQADQAGFSGASLDGFMLASSDFLDQPFNTAYYGHEVSHQWWGGLVRVNGSRGRWMLQEGLAQYGSLRAVELLEGSARASRYRRNGYPGYYDFESSGTGYLRLKYAGLDHPLSDLPDDDAISRRLSNSKGMLVWDLLAREVGRHQFNVALRSIAKKYAYSRITWEEFLREIQNSASKDLALFYKLWFDTTEIPFWEITFEKTGNVVSGNIHQTPENFQVTVPVKIICIDGQEFMQMVVLSGSNSRFSVSIPSRVKAVEVDPDFTILHSTPALRDESIVLAPYTKAYLKLLNGAVKDAEEEFRNGLRSVSADDPFGVQFLLRYGLSQALNDQNKSEDALQEIQAALALKNQRQEVLPWAYLHLAYLAKKMGNQQLLKEAVNGVIKADSALGGKTGAVELAQLLLR